MDVPTAIQKFGGYKTRYWNMMAFYNGAIARGASNSENIESGT